MDKASSFTFGKDVTVHSFCLCLLLMTQVAFVDSIDQDQTAQNMQSDL